MEERRPLLEAQSQGRVDEQERKQIDFAKLICVVCNNEMVFGRQILCSLDCQGNHIAHNSCLDLGDMRCPVCKEKASIVGSTIIFEKELTVAKVKMPKPKNVELSKHRKIKWWCCK